MYTGRPRKVPTGGGAFEWRRGQGGGGSDQYATCLVHMASVTVRKGRRKAR
jgi:hypothetical protein